MPSLNPYLNFKDNCEEAFNFYKNVFGGEFKGIMRYNEVPDYNPVSEKEANKIMHISLPIGQNNVLMGSDIPDSMISTFKEGDNFSISISTDNEEETERYFYRLSEGGRVTMPLERTFWGAYFGMVTDKFGVNWMINNENKENQ